MTRILQRRVKTLEDLTGAGTGAIVALTGTFGTVSGIGSVQTARTTTALTKNANTTLAPIVGLSLAVVAGTYKFKCSLPSTVANGTGGIKYAFKYTTAVLSALEATAKGYTASAVAVQHTTTATDEATLFTQAAVVLLTEIEGTMVVTTGGTIAVEMAQNTSNASDTVALVGGSFELKRIA